MKLYLITGGSRGLGRNAAIKLAKKGNDVIITYHSRQDEADKVVKEIEGMGRKAAAVQFDVKDSKNFEGFVGKVRDLIKSKWNRDSIDGLLNNAGTGMYVPYSQVTEAQLDEMYAVHFKAPYLLTQKMLPMLKKGSRVLNVSSGLARFSFPGSSAYASMKGAVEVMTRYQAKELGELGISVNVIAPGAIETDFGGGRVRDNKEINTHIAQQTALGRVGLPDDIGDIMSVLLSDETYWVNGQRIEASGGMLL